MTRFTVHCQHCHTTDGDITAGDLMIVGAAEWAFTCTACGEPNRWNGTRRTMDVLRATGVRTDAEIAVAAFAHVNTIADLFPTNAP